MVVDNRNRIIFPVRTLDSKNPFNTERHVALTYFSFQGHQQGHAYLEKSADVTGLCVNSRNEVFVSDAANGCIWIVNDLQRVANSIGLDRLYGENLDPKPGAICVDSEDNLYITDTANSCVKSYTRDGTVRFYFGSCGERPGQFQCPIGIYVDALKRIAVVDNGNQRVQLVDESGHFLRYIVRLHDGDDVYQTPVAVAGAHNEGCVAVLLNGTNGNCHSEVRVYKCEGSADVMSC